MANTKGAMIRQIIIDRCLQSEEGYSTAKMMEKCNVALEERGYTVVTSLNTIRNDIDEISNTYHVNIEQLSKGSRSKRYRYEDRTFSVYTSPLTEKDIIILNDLVHDLGMFQGRPQFEWLAEMNFRLQLTMNRYTAVVYDDNPQLVGMVFFQPLFDAIIHSKAVRLIYKSYKNECEVQRIVHPYMLRQYNKRWFLIALTEGFEDRLSNYALDRIVGLERVAIPYVSHEGFFDLSTYYNDVVGVSVPSHGEKQIIELSVASSLYPYIASKPIHHSQQVIVEKDDEVVIRLTLIPNYEFEQLLLSYGEGVEVLNPLSLRETMKKRIELIWNKYNRFK